MAGTQHFHGSDSMHFVTENITAYMKQIEKIPRISVEREVELYNIQQTGTEQERIKAREELICSNLRLVVKIAHDFKRFGLTFADIVAEGNCGLMMAADRFIPSKGSRFSCYASWWIKQSIRRAIANQTRTVRVPGGAAQRVLQLQRLKAGFMGEHGREPTIEELKQITGYTEKTLIGIDKADIQTYSMNETIKEGDDTTFGDMVAEETNEYSVKKEADAAELLRIQKLLCKLTDKDQYIISKLYGLNCTALADVAVCINTGISMKELSIRKINIIDKLRTLVKESE